MQIDMSGCWRGMYAYLTPENPRVGNEAVPFEMNLTMIAPNVFSGEGQDKGEFAVPGVAEVNGQLDGLNIRFVKRMPNILINDAGAYISFARWIRKHHRVKGVADPLPYDIFYQGVWKPETRWFAGAWTISASLIKLRGGHSMSTGDAKGTWVMQPCADSSKTL